MFSIHHTCLRFLMGLTVFVPSQFAVSQEPSTKVPTNSVNTKVTPSQKTVVIPLKHRKPMFIERNIEEMFLKSLFDYEIAADAESNQILLRGEESIVDAIVRFITAIDSETRARSSSHESDKVQLWRDRVHHGDLKGLNEAEIRKGLMSEVQEEFRKTQNQLRETLKELEDRVKAARELLERREQLVDAICQHQISDLMRNDTVGLSRTGTNPDEQSAALLHIQQERLSLLREKVAEMEAKHANGMIPLEEVLQARNQMIAAQLESSASDQDRMELMQQIVENAAQFETQMKQRHEKGLIPASELQNAKLKRLTLEAELAKLKGE